MKKVVLFLLLAMPIAVMAQVNEMFYVPKKQVKQENVAKMLSSSVTEEDEEWGVADNGNTRDVDEYNRRGSNTISADNVEALLQQESVEECDEYVYEDDTDYDYSTRIVRFHNPTTVIVSSPWYYDVYPSWGYYDYCYDDYWNWSIGWNSLCGWSIGAAWHWPLHSWHWGGGHHHHHPHHVAPPVYSHRVQPRVPTVSLSDRGRTGRVPVAGAATTKRPGTQVVNGRVDRTNRENVGGGSLRDDRNRGGSSSTYNRRSSTSVRKENAGGSNNRTDVSSGSSRNNRTEVSSGSSRNNRGSSSGSSRSSVRSGSGSGRSSVGAASRGSSSSRGSAPSRGGVSRGGRR